MHSFRFTQALVRNVLEDPRREWTAQGFGFLRTYFGPVDHPKLYRLNLWHHKFTVPDVSTIHDHPWDLTSLIIAGHFTNQRYTVQEFDRPATHDFTTLKTGVGGGLVKDPISHCKLIPQPVEIYFPGDTYHQRADEVHETIFADGAVTLNHRVGDTERARVFWPAGTPWVDAMPRLATPNEVASTVQDSLKKWFQ